MRDDAQQMQGLGVTLIGLQRLPTVFHRTGDIAGMEPLHGRGKRG